jgi:ring-1,2-phenylacetyl-CoA epoxidase subunit PaaC
MASRILAEERVHVQHADTWINRLGKGTAESRQRMQAAVDALWPDVASLFEPTVGQDELERAGLYPLLDRPIAALWVEAVLPPAAAAGLNLPSHLPALESSGGRRGVHTPDFDELLAELTEVYRLEPGAAW